MAPVGDLPRVRTVAWLRLLLLATAAGAAALFLGNRPERSVGALPLWLGLLGGGVALASIALLLVSGLVRRPWQLAFQLVFDLLWIGGLLWLTGGVSSPGITLMFAVLLIGTQALPGVAPFVLPTVASLILAVVAALYLARVHPLPEALLAAEPQWVDPRPMLGALVLQVAALFLVDLLGQALAGRLREHRFFTAELLDQLGEGVLAVDRQGQIAYANAGLARLLPLPPGEIAGRRVVEVLDDGALGDLRRWLVEEDWPRVERLQLGGLHLVARVDQLTDRKGRAIGRLLVLADETRLRVLEDNSRRNARLAELGEMAAGIAHEVRNPLTSLRGCAQELATMAARSSNGDAGNLAGIMIAEADRLARIVEDVLALTRVRTPDVRPVAVGPLVRDLLDLVRARPDLPPGIALTIDGEADGVQVMADAGQLRQVLLNLVANAIDACRDRPAPRIAIAIDRCHETAGFTRDARPQAAVRLRISDTGVGIPPGLQERVFAPFFSTKAQGTGLGLSLVARIVRDHGGTIDLTSTPGVGTTVEVVWPAPPLSPRPDPGARPRA